MSKYDEYLKRYCMTYRVSKEDAEKHSIVQEVKRQYEESEDKKDGK